MRIHCETDFKREKHCVFLTYFLQVPIQTMEQSPENSHNSALKDDEIEFEEIEAQPEVLDVVAEVAAADLLALWTRSCCPISFTSITSESSQGTPRNEKVFHVTIDDNNSDRSNVLVTFGSGDIGRDTCIFSLDGKLTFVAVDEEDVIRTRSQMRSTRNDQYNVTIDLSRASSDAVERNLNQIFSKATSGPTGKQIATKTGLTSVSRDNFHASWRSDVRLFIRNFVARPQKNFSDKRDFSVPDSSSKLKKPANFVYGPAPLFFDEDGHYIPPKNVRDEVLQKDVRVMFTIDMSPSPLGKVYCNLELLSVQVLSSSVVAASPSKKRRLELGI